MMTLTLLRWYFHILINGTYTCTLGMGRIRERKKGPSCKSVLQSLIVERKRRRNKRGGGEEGCVKHGKG